MAQGNPLGEIGGGGGAGAALGALGGISSVLGPAGAILGAGVGIYQLFSNLEKERKAKAELEAIKDPFYKIQDEYFQNRNIDAGLAGGGMPAAEQDYYTTESQRGLGAGISGTLQAGGTPGDIAKLFDVFDRGIDKTAAASAEQHLKNIQYFKESNKDLAGQRTTQWAINEYQPIQEKKKQLSEIINNTQQNAYGGAATSIGSISALGTSMQNDQLLKSLFKMPKSQQIAGQTDTEDPYQITAEPLSNLSGMRMPIDEAQGTPNSLSSDEQAAFNYWLKNRKI